MDQDIVYFTTRPSREGTQRGRGSYQQSLPDALHHPALDAGFTQDVVRSDARLATVDELAPGDATDTQKVGRTTSGFHSLPVWGKSRGLLSEPPSSCLPAGHSDVAVLVDVAGALPAQLQGHRGEVACRGLHHHSAYVAAASVEDVVKAQPEQLLGLGHPTRHHWVQVLETKSSSIGQDSVVPAHSGVSRHTQPMRSRMPRNKEKNCTYFWRYFVTALKHISEVSVLYLNLYIFLTTFYFYISTQTSGLSTPYIGNTRLWLLCLKDTDYVHSLTIVAA